MDEKPTTLPDAVTHERSRRSEETFRLLVESVKDYAIFMLDPEGFITTWNLGAQRLKGYSAAEAIGQHFSIFYSREDMAAGKPAHELEIARAEGRVEDRIVDQLRCALRFADAGTAIFDHRGERARTYTFLRSPIKIDIVSASIAAPNGHS